MVLISFLTSFQWSVITFFTVQLAATIKFFIWVITKIELLNNAMIENNKRDSETRRDVDIIRSEERQNFKDISKRLDSICQALVRVEEKTSHIEKQLDKY